MTIKNLLIVESPNDKAFIELLLAGLGLINNTITQTIETVDLHKFPDPKNPEKLLRGKSTIDKRLIGIRSELRSRYRDIERIGIVLDADTPPNWTFDKNLDLVNTAIAKAFGVNPQFTNESVFIKIPVKDGANSFDLSFSVFLLNMIWGNLKAIWILFCTLSEKMQMKKFRMLIVWRNGATV